MQDGSDIFDGSNVAGASLGNIVGSGVGGEGIGTIIQDLREAYLEDFGGSGHSRDLCATSFDERLLEIAQRVLDIGE